MGADPGDQGANARRRSPSPLRGRFLVGSRPVAVDLVRRFVACAADSGIDVFRLHDPLNDISNLREAAEAITAADHEFDAGLVYSPGRTGETETVAERASRLPELGAARVLIHDPSGSLHPRKAAELVEAVRDASGLPVGLYCQGSGGTALAAALEASRAGADLIATAVYPLALTLHRVSGESVARALASLDLDTGVDIDALWRASDIVDEHIGDEPVSPIPPRVATRAAQHRLPPGLVAALDLHLRANAAGDRIDEVLDELMRIRAEAGWPPLAAPIGQILASQALINVLSASRYQTVVDELRGLLTGRFGSPPAAIDETVLRAVRLVSGDEPPPEDEVELADVRESAEGLAASEEELLLLALFGESAEPLLRAIRGRGRRAESDLAGLEPIRAERIREVVRIVQESGVNEVTIEDGGMRVTVRRGDDAGPACRRARSRTRPRTACPSRAARPSRRGRDPRRGADGRHLLPRARSDRRPVRHRGRRRRRRADPLHPRGDEADERDQGRGRGAGEVDPGRERAAGRVRPGPLRARARRRPPTGVLACFAASSSPTEARSRFA